MLIVGADTMVAQTVIDGMVTDSLGVSVDAYVTVSPKGESSIIGFADTDEKGNYRLEFTTDADSVAVIAAGMAIVQHVRMVANRSQRLNFVVSSCSDCTFSNSAFQDEHVRHETVYSDCYR